MPEIHIFGFGHRTDAVEEKIRKFLLKELDKHPHPTESAIYENIRNGCVFVGHHETTVRTLVGAKSSPYILVQSTDQAESNILAIILIDLSPRIDIVQGSELLGFTPASEEIEG